jgi:apolipoprotein N-acyltransferase
MASTVGVSAFVTPDGTVHQATGYNVPATIVQRLDLSTGRTMATFLGEGPEFVLVAMAIGALIAALWFRRKRVSGGTSS